MNADTLSISQETLQQWRSGYDYTSGLAPAEQVQGQSTKLPDLSSSSGSIFDDLHRWLGNVPPLVWWLLLALLVALVAYWVLRHVDWHRQRKKEKKKGEEEEADSAEDIYEVDDYTQGISEASGLGNWAESIRLVYLATLRHLDEAGRIHWERFKTPMDYVDESGAESLRPLTIIYLAVRFGHYPADKTMYEETVRLREATERGGAHA